MDRTVDAVVGKESKDGFEEGGEFRLAHLAAAHGEVAMMNAAQAFLWFSSNRDVASSRS